MNTQTLSILILFLLKHKLAYASVWPVQSYSEIDVFLQGFIIESSQVNTVFACYRKCEDITYCASINMNLTNMICELKYSTKTRHPEETVNQANTIYMEIQDALGSTPHNPIPSCKWLKNLDSQAKSGVYWMKFNESSSVPFQVFCDMTTDGGGWTLVYSYKFTQYSEFDKWENAITPLPNWPVDTSSGNFEPISTTIPLSESSQSAMEFGLWKKIGNEFLYKSNITNWVACVEDTGSFVNWVPGRLTCRVVKAITPTCTTVTPNKFKIHSCAPGLYLNEKEYLYLEGNKRFCQATHDPCGTGSFKNHLTNVAHPGGVIYFR